MKEDYKPVVTLKVCVCESPIAKHMLTLSASQGPKTSVYRQAESRRMSQRKIKVPSIIHNIFRYICTQVCYSLLENEENSGRSIRRLILLYANIKHVSYDASKTLSY